MMAAARWWREAGAALVCVMAWAAGAGAHSFEPALLDLRERAAGVFDVVWKAPGRGSGALAGSGGLSPVLPAHCVPRGPEGARIDCGQAGLAGHPIRITGIEESRVDAMVRITWHDGRMTTGVVHAGAPVFHVGARAAGLGAGVPGRSVLGAYVALGAEHILGGWDHLAFVLGLVLLVRSWRALVRTITAFTLAHSVTLALAVTGIVRVSPAPVEVLIAASIVLLAREIARGVDAPASLTRRAPWVVAFAFGLLHGLGFAGALVEIGLPPDHVALALLAFNVGVELGQLAFVGAALAPVAIGRRVVPAGRLRRRAPAYVLGALASAWTLERVAAFWVPPG